jgi:hypothetical protein
VEIVDVLGDDLAFEILPGAASDAIAGIDGFGAAGCLGAEVGAPGLVACARPLRQGLALTIRAFQAAEVRALARPVAATKKVMFGDCGGGCCARLAVEPNGTAATDATSTKNLALDMVALPV